MNSLCPDRLMREVAEHYPTLKRDQPELEPDLFARAITRLGATNLTGTVAVQVLVHDLDDTQYDDDRSEVR